MNTLLQVWFHDLTFRQGIYHFTLSHLAEKDPKVVSYEDGIRIMID
jgi:hypothetical protein